MFFLPISKNEIFIECFYSPADAGDFLKVLLNTKKKKNNQQLKNKYRNTNTWTASVDHE